MSSTGFEGDKQYDFFLSYSTKDAELVRAVERELNDTGIDLFRDEIAIGWGKSINEKVFSGLEAARHVVVFISQQSLESNWVKKEISVALTREIETDTVVILPVLLASQEDFFKSFPFMKDKKYIKFEGVTELAREMKQLARGDANTKFVFNHPRTFSGPTWVRLQSTKENHDTTHVVRLLWGPWYRKTRVKLDQSTPLFLLHSKGYDDESIPLRVETNKSCYVAVGQGDPNSTNVVDVNPYWVDASSRFKRLIGEIFLWPKFSDRSTRNKKR